MSQKFVSNGPKNNGPKLVENLAWRQSYYMYQWWPYLLIHICREELNTRNQNFLELIKVFKYVRLGDDHFSREILSLWVTIPWFTTRYQNMTGPTCITKGGGNIYIICYCWKNPNSSHLFDHGFMDVIPIAGQSVNHKKSFKLFTNSRRIEELR